MKICEMVDVEAWARLTKIIQQMRPKPKARTKVKAPRQLTDFERNSNRLRSEVARLKAKSPIIPVSMGR